MILKFKFWNTNSCSYIKGKLGSKFVGIRYILQWDSWKKNSQAFAKRTLVLYYGNIHVLVFIIRTIRKIGI